MKRVELLVTKHTVAGQDQDLDYKEAYLIHISMSEQGMDFAEMKKVERIFDKLTEATDHVLLEDADYELLKTKLTAAKFRVYTPALKDMLQSLVDAPAHLVEAGTG